MTTCSRLAGGAPLPYSPALALPAMGRDVHFQEDDLPRHGGQPDGTARYAPERNHLRE